jgi:hypothetical protein
MSLIRSQSLQPESLALIYVSTVGTDANPGTSIGKPVRTIARAVQIANASITDEGKRALITVAPGVYEEDNLPIRVKRNVAIKGEKLRSCYIQPAPGQEYNGFFKVDSNFMAWGFTFRGHQADETRQAWAISFDELADNTAIGAVGLGAYIFTSPYIQNCTSLTAEDDAGTAGSASTGSTGGGMEVDGNKCAINTPIRSMVVDSFTQVNLGGPGCLVKNDGYAQLVSFFGTFCEYHVKTEAGGQCNLSGGSTTDFGIKGLIADGYSPAPLYTGGARLAAYGATRLEKTVTIDVSTDTFSATAHGLSANDQINFSATQGTLPTNLTAGLTYYVLSTGLTADAFRVSTTPGGSALDMSGAATGTYKFVRQGALEIDVVDFTANRLGRAIAYPSAGSLGSTASPVTINARGGTTAGSGFTVTLGTVSNIKHTYIGGGTVTVGGTTYPVTSATYNNATGATVITATGYAPTIGASVTLSGLKFICDSASRPNAGQLMFPQLVFPRNSSTGAAEAKTFAYTRTGNFTLTYQEAASPNGPDHEYVSGGTAVISGTDYGVAGATYNKTTGLVTLTTKTQLPAGNGSVVVNGLVYICPTSGYIVTSSIPIDSNGAPVAANSVNRAGYRVLFYSGINGGLKDPIAQGQRLDFRNRSQISAPSHTFEYVGSGTNYDALPWNGGVPNQGNAILQTNNGRVFSSNTNELGNFKVGEQFSVDGTTGEVTINTSSFNLSGLNAVGPFSRNGGLSTVGVQLQEVSNNPALIASTGAPDGNTVPTQSAIIGYLTNRTINTGSGLTGGGNLVQDRTINLNLKANGGVVLESSQVAIDLGASNITGTLGFSDGGTGATSQTGARTALAINNVDNTSDANKPISTATQVALDLKAPLASPSFTGIPVAPTATAGTNTTQLATTAFVSAAVNALINGAPGALDTLLELAAAMGNDPNFAATVTNSLALKAPLNSPSFTGNASFATITAGTWNGSVIAPLYGGTGIAGGFANGELLIGKANGTLAKATLTAGTGIGITNADGSITIAATTPNITGGNGLTYTNGLLDVNLKANGGIVFDADNLALDLSASSITGTLAAIDGGTGIAGSFANGELLIGKANGTLAKATLTPGVGISITNTDGGITIASSGANFTAGSGLTLTGNQLDVNLKANGGLTLESNNLAVNLSASNITGTLAIGDGGTGATTATNARTNLGLGNVENTALSTWAGSSELNTVGTLISGSLGTGFTAVAIAQGGTGATTASAARTALGLGNVNNTSDANKPISTATQAALDLRAPLESPTFTGNASFGTITAGTWNGGVIGQAYGGTGSTTGSITAANLSFTASSGALTLAANTGAVNLTAAANSNMVLTTSGTGVLSVPGNVLIGGNVTINGTTTSINATNLDVADKNITLGNTTTPSDAVADQGGITLLGTTSKTLTWGLATAAWTSSENFNLVTGKGYLINGTSVLSATTLGTGVTASSLTSVGTLTAGSLGAGFTTVAIAQGGTGQTTASAAFNALSPITTLGDLIIGSGTNTATRLPGNTTTTRQFLSQTGTGSASAAPAWATIAQADVTGLVTSLASKADALLLEGASQTTNYTLALGDQGRVVVFDSAAPLGLTIPLESAVAFPIGAIVHVYNTGAGAISIAGGAGVTVRNITGTLPQYKEISLRKRAANEWVAVGL